MYLQCRLVAGNRLYTETSAESARPNVTAHVLAAVAVATIHIHLQCLRVHTPVYSTTTAATTTFVSPLRRTAHQQQHTHTENQGLGGARCGTHAQHRRWQKINTPAVTSWNGARYNSQDHQSAHTHRQKNACVRGTGCVHVQPQSWPRDRVLRASRHQSLAFAQWTAHPALVKGNGAQETAFSY